MTSDEKWQAVSEKKIFKDLYDFIHIQGQGKIPRGDISLIITFNEIHYFNHTL